MLIQDRNQNISVKKEQWFYVKNVNLNKLHFCRNRLYTNLLFIQKNTYCALKLMLYWKLNKMGGITLLKH